MCVKTKAEERRNWANSLPFAQPRREYFATDATIPKIETVKIPKSYFDCDCDCSVYEDWKKLIKRLNDEVVAANKARDEAKAELKLSEHRKLEAERSRDAYKEAAGYYSGAYAKATKERIQLREENTRLKNENLQVANENARLRDKRDNSTGSTWWQRYHQAKQELNELRKKNEDLQQQVDSWRFVHIQNGIEINRQNDKHRAEAEAWKLTHETDQKAIKVARDEAAFWKSAWHTASYFADEFMRIANDLRVKVKKLSRQLNVRLETAGRKS